MAAALRQGQNPLPPAGCLAHGGGRAGADTGPYGVGTNRAWRKSHLVPGGYIIRPYGVKWPGTLY